MNDQAAGAFQGAGSGAATGAGFGPWGAAIGAGAGGLIGLMEGRRNQAEQARRERLDNAYAAIQTAYSPFVKGTAGHASTGAALPGSFGSLVSGGMQGVNAYQGLANTGLFGNGQSSTQQDPYVVNGGMKDNRTALTAPSRRGLKEV